MKDFINYNVTIQTKIKNGALISASMNKFLVHTFVCPGIRPQLYLVTDVFDPGLFFRNIKIKHPHLFTTRQKACLYGLIQAEYTIAYLAVPTMYCNNTLKRYGSIHVFFTAFLNYKDTFIMCLNDL